MTFKYPRERRSIVAINGVYDPCQDTSEMDRLWDLAGRGWQGSYGVTYTRVAAPGGIGGFAHFFEGRINNVIQLYGVQSLTPYKDQGFRYYFSPFSPFYWKMTADFRIRIALDQTGDSGVLSASLGFCLDGGAMYPDLTGDNQTRMHVNFNVNRSLIAVTRSQQSPQLVAEILSSASWSGSYDTWYDVRIEWSRDWYLTPGQINVTVFVNKTQELTYNVTYPDDWRADPASGLNYHSLIGRCGPSICVENDGGSTNSTDVDGYFADILITQDIKVLSWKYTDAIIQSGNPTKASFRAISARTSMVGEGSDVVIWKRNKLSDQWVSRFRGIIRDVDRVRKKIIHIEAEGWESILFGEKTENISHTTQTAAVIIQDAINNPDKVEFDVTTFFDSVSATYSREYVNNPKLDVSEEMASLEGFFLFLDHTLAWHFQSPRTNALPIHLIRGQSKILNVQVKQSFVRVPNILRIIGYGGIYAERELSAKTFSSGSVVTRNINRQDLLTQTEVDEYLNYVLTFLNEPLMMVDVKMRSNPNLKKGYTIRLTDPTQGIKNTLFSITSITGKSINRMNLNLLEVKPHASLLLADLTKRTDRKESELFFQDEIATNKIFNVEGLATLLISGTYEVEFAAAIQRSGDLVITDELIDDLIEFWNEESPTQPTHLAYGTGTTEALPSDTAMETETSRTAATVTQQEKIGLASESEFRTTRYTITILNPSNLTEIGLLNAASSGTLDCRTTFASYSETGTVTVRINLTVIPHPGLAYVTALGIAHTAKWFYDGTALDLDYIAHCSFRNITAPEPFGYYLSSYYGSAFTYVPDAVTRGTFTKTKLLHQNKLKYEFVYANYDLSAHFGGNAGGSPFEERFLSVFRNTGTLSAKPMINIFHRSLRKLDDFDDSACLWIIWLKIKAGGMEY